MTGGGGGEGEGHGANVRFHLRRTMEALHNSKDILGSAFFYVVPFFCLLDLAHMSHSIQANSSSCSFSRKGKRASYWVLSIGFYASGVHVRTSSLCKIREINVKITLHPVCSRVSVSTFSFGGKAEDAAIGKIC